MTSSCCVPVWLSATQKTRNAACVYLKNCMNDSTYGTSFPSAWGALQQAYPWIGIRFTYCIHSRLDSHSLRLIVIAEILHRKEVYGPYNDMAVEITYPTSNTLVN